MTVRCRFVRGRLAGTSQPCDFITAALMFRACDAGASERSARQITSCRSHRVATGVLSALIGWRELHLTETSEMELGKIKAEERENTGDWRESLITDLVPYKWADPDTRRAERKIEASSSKPRFTSE